MLKPQYKKVYAFDPARGKRKYSIEEFQSCWTGYIVNCVPREDFKKRNLYQGFYKIYITILLKQKSIFPCGYILDFNDDIVGNGSICIQSNY